VQRMGAVLDSLRQAGLPANLGRCAVGRREVRYLGYHLGSGQVRPEVDKTAERYQRPDYSIALHRPWMLMVVADFFSCCHGGWGVGGVG